MKKLALALLALLAIGASASAQVTATATPPTAIACAYNATPPSPTDTQPFWVQCDNTGAIKIAGTFSATGGTVSNASSGVATSATNTGSIAYNYGFNGTTWDQLQVDASKFLKVNCTAGCSGGTFNNNADTVATSATNGQTAGWLYGFNGTTWDRLRTDTTSGLWVQLKGGSIANTSFAATQATAANLNATVVGLGTAGTAAGGILSVQGVASMTKLLVTPDSVALPANQSVNESQINGVTPLMGNGVTGTGSQRVTIASDNTAFSVNATQAGTWNINNISGTVSLPTGAATAAGLTTINTTLGSPFQAGGALAANQSVNVAQFGGVSTATGQVAVSTVPVTATNTALVTALRPDSPGIIALGPAADTSSVPQVLSPTSSATSALSHASVTSLGTSLVVKASAGNLYGFNCTAIAGAAAGNCIAYNGSSVPGTGALTGANVLDSCNFDTTTKGCSLSRIPMGVNYGTGIVILVSSAASPFTYTTGTDTAFISADYK